jgi:ribonuclease VapC
VIVIDSSALIAILHREPEADGFLRIISEAQGGLLSAVSLLEVSMVLAGRTGDATSWMELDALISRAGIEVVAQDAELANTARLAFLRYGRGRHRAALNLGDYASLRTRQTPRPAAPRKGRRLSENRPSDRRLISASVRCEVARTT